jgi:hypothetical protein
MDDRKPHCKPGESDATFALGMAIVWSAITFSLGIVGVISLF